MRMRIRFRDFYWMRRMMCFSAEPDDPLIGLSPAVHGLAAPLSLQEGFGRTMSRKPSGWCVPMASMYAAVLKALREEKTQEKCGNL